MDNTFLVIVVLAIYFLPTFIAKGRNHPSSGGIFLLNLLLGWTLLGWIVAVIWAASGSPGVAGPTPATHVRCPECREFVLRDARKCKHCGCALIPQ